MYPLDIGAYAEGELVRYNRYMTFAEAFVVERYPRRVLRLAQWCTGPMIS